MTYENLTVEIKDRIARVTVNRPKVLNALNDRTIREIHAAFASFKENAEVGAVILTGAGEKAFVAGADINELATMSPLGGEASSRLGQVAFSLIENLGKPVIAAVNGFALGGGCELAMACTLRVASEKARFGQPEVKLGVTPGFAGTQRLPRLVGKGRALDLLLTGRLVDAQEALAMGLVNRVVPAADLMPKARELALSLAALAPAAMRSIIEAVHRGTEMAFHEAAFLEATLFGLCFSTADMREGTRAFLEKRPAMFTGK